MPPWTRASALLTLHRRHCRWGASMQQSSRMLTAPSNFAHLIHNVCRKECASFAVHWLLSLCPASGTEAPAGMRLPVSGMQESARALLGNNTTAFTRIVDGSHSLRQGDLVSLEVKPAMIGRIEYFSIAQVRSSNRLLGQVLLVRAMGDQTVGYIAS